MPALRLACRSGRALEFAVMPLCCAFCGAARRRGEPAICAGCEAEMAMRDAGISFEPGAGVVCAECQDRPMPFQAAVAPLAYAFPVDAAIRNFKYHRNMYYATAFGELICSAAAELPGDIDALLPVPLHWLRHGLRGFNQAAEICRPLQRASGLPVLRNVAPAHALPVRPGSAGAAPQSFRRVCRQGCDPGTARSVDRRRDYVGRDLRTARTGIAGQQGGESQCARTGKSLNSGTRPDCATDRFCVLVSLCVRGDRQSERAWRCCWSRRAPRSPGRKASRSLRSPRRRSRIGFR